MQDFDWQQMMKSPVANWHFVRWLAQRYDGGTPSLLCNHCCIHDHNSKYNDLASLIVNINQDMEYSSMLAGLYIMAVGTPEIALQHFKLISLIKTQIVTAAATRIGCIKTRILTAATKMSKLDLRCAGREPLPGYDPVAQRQEAATATARRTSSGALPGKAFP